MLTNKRKAQLIILSTFLLGAIAGASGQYLFSKQSQTRQVSPQNMTDEMARTVRLSANQRTEVDKILEDARQKYQDVRNHVRPQFTAIREDSRRRIRELLSADQQSLYDKWNVEQDARRSREEAARNAK